MECKGPDLLLASNPINPFNSNAAKMMMIKIMMIMMTSMVVLI